jgi:hypothetical protein
VPGAIPDASEGGPLTFAFAHNAITLRRVPCDELASEVPLLAATPGNLLEDVGAWAYGDGGLALAVALLALALVNAPGTRT